MELSFKLSVLHTENDKLQQAIKRNENRDRIRIMMTSETGEETLRYLVEKYIAKPAKAENEKLLRLERLHYEDEDDADSEEDQEDEGYLIRKTERVMDQVEKFLISYLSDARRLKVSA